MIEDLLKEKERKDAYKMIDAHQPRIMATLEFHIEDISKYLESKNCITPLSPMSTIDEKLR
jgi:hypothetical protein